MRDLTGGPSLVLRVAPGHMARRRASKRDRTPPGRRASWRLSRPSPARRGPACCLPPTPAEETPQAIPRTAMAKVWAAALDLSKALVALCRGDRAANDIDGNIRTFWAILESAEGANVVCGVECPSTRVEASLLIASRPSFAIDTTRRDAGQARPARAV